MPIDGEPLKAFAISQGFATAGICDAKPAPHLSSYKKWIAEGKHAGMAYMADSSALRSDPQALLPEAKSILAVSLNYFQAVDPGPPRVARYALGRDYHKVLRKKLKRIAAYVEETWPGTRTRPCVDSAPILERDYGFSAGLGWYGKNTCLIDSKRGSWFFIGLLLLSERFQTDPPAVGGCGNCTNCIDSCPTGALSVEPGQPVGVLDSAKCISYLTIEHKGPLGNADLQGWVFGCDICQEVCPFNQQRESQPLRARETSEPDFDARDANLRPSLVKLAAIDREEFARRYAGTALMRAGASRMRRNAQALLERETRWKAAPLSYVDSP